MEKEQLIAILLIMSAVLIIEFMILLSLVYFATMPLFFFIITVALRLFSFFLLGFTMIFLALTLFGKKPEFTIEWWILHLKELTRNPFTNLFLSLALIAFSVLLGGALAMLTERIFFLPHTERLRHWVLTHFK